jgi:proteasome lid subunit RPN8/RPN11
VPVSNSKFDRFWDPEDTKERCGFILKGNRMCEVQNTHPQPEHGFEIDPEAIIRHEDQIKATWHTHPNSDACLSEADYICFLNWPHLEHYIIGKDGVRRYVVVDGIVMNANDD